MYSNVKEPVLRRTSSAPEPQRAPRTFCFAIATIHYPYSSGSVAWNPCQGLHSLTSSLYLPHKGITEQNSMGEGFEE